jgi:hypothetical protein
MNPRQEELKCRNCEQTFDTPEELEEHEKECIREQASMEKEFGEAEQTQQEKE